MTSRTLFLVALTTLAACASSGPSLGTSEQDDTVHPEGDENMGTIRVTLPAGVALEAGGFKFSVSVAGTAVAIDTDVRVKKGTQCLTLSTVRYRGDLNTPSSPYTQSIQDCSVTIEAGKTTNYALSGLRITYDDGRLWPLWGVKPFAGVYLQGPSGSWSNAFGEEYLLSGPTRDIGQHPPAWKFAHASGAADVVPVIAGHYQTNFMVPNIQTSGVDVAQGELKDWDITPPEWRHWIHTVPPSREFGDPQNVGNECDRMAKYVLVDRAARQYPERSYPTDLSFWPDTSSWQALAPNDLQGRAKEYTLFVYGLPLPQTATTGGSNEITMRRIDVDDVELTAEDGTKRKVAGEYSIQLVGPNGEKTPHPWRIFTRNGLTAGGGGPRCDASGSFPTRTGIDVPAGHYNVHVTWKDGTGSQARDYDINY